MYNFNEANSRLGSNCTKWDRYKSRYNLDDIIPLWVADMDFNCLPEINEAIIKRAEHGIYGYTDPSNECLEAIVNFEARHHNIHITKDDIVFTTGVVYAIYTAVEMLVKEDEKVMVMTPVYPPFFNTPASLNKEVVYNPLLINEDKVEINYTKLEELLKNDSKIKVLIFCNPHNPLGNIWSKEELNQLLAITHKYNVKVVSDEIHADIVFKPYKHISMLDVDSKYNDDIILLGAPTKTFNLAGLKISYAIIPNLEMRTEFAERAKASGLSSINIFGFTACEAAYNYGDTWLNECLDYVYDNFIWLDNFLKENLPLCKFKIPHATYLAWVDFSKYNVPEDFQQVLLHNAKVELQDGRGFKNSDGYQRINCACPRSTLEEGMKRIAKYLNK